MKHHPDLLSAEELTNHVEACGRNSRESQKTLYSSFYGYAMAICDRYAGNQDDAVEILNEGFLKVFREIHHYKPAYADVVSSFKGWLRKIMVYTSIDHFRNRVTGNNPQRQPAGVTTEPETESESAALELPSSGLQNEPVGPANTNNNTGNQNNNLVRPANITDNSGKIVSGKRNVIQQTGKKQTAGPNKTKSALIKQTVGKGDAGTVPGMTSGFLTQPKTTDTKDKTNSNDKTAADNKVNNEPATAAQNSDKPVESAEKSKGEDKKALTQTKTQKKSSTGKKMSFFFISASGGPDVSFTSGDPLGRVKFTGGAGLGYTYKERFTLRTGFYSGRKIYTASPDQYHGNAWFYQYYPNLQKVEANCKVYEIPVALSYNFRKNGKQSWFASAGVSTLLMKEETYDYYYKYTPTSPVISRQHTTYNKNKHLFSIMTVSAGYQRNIGKRFSLISELYIKLPLQGVGNGKVKLNSTGVLFSVSFRPFN